MAEYYPLLSKAVGSLPNSTPETRRVVYERARKALIGQLRTLHPPIPDEDIDRESVELDRAIARLEDELAGGGAPGAAPAAPLSPAAPRPIQPRPPASQRPNGGALGPIAPKPFTPLRTKAPASRTAPIEPSMPSDVQPDPVATTPSPPVLEAEPPPPQDVRPKLNVQRPIAPQPLGAKGPKRQMWIIWVGVAVAVVLVAGAAWKLRDRPETIARTKPAEQPVQADGSGKISERVGEKAPDQSTPPSATSKDAPEPPSAPTPSAAPEPRAPTQPAEAQAPTTNNPEVPVAQRAALLIEAPDEPNKVKTYLGTVVWKLNNVSTGSNDAVGLGVEADVDLPDDKMKAVVTFEKNTDSSLPASHTIKVRFIVLPGSASGDVKQINVPQLRREDSPSGDPLAGVTVPVIQNSFLVGLSPGNAETANLELLRSLQWIDIPMLLTSGRIAKLTFEKGPAGQRDITDAVAAWQKP